MAGNAHHHGKNTVNKHMNSVSYIMLIDDSGRFTAKTTVTSVVDGAFTWTGKPLLETPQRLGIKLTCTHGLTVVPKVNPRDEGNLTIVLADGPPVDAVPVDYVNAT
jgi:hypothetical protein